MFVRRNMFQFLRYKIVYVAHNMSKISLYYNKNKDYLDDAVEDDDSFELPTSVEELEEA